MKKIHLFCSLVSLTFSVSAQPPLNEWYDYGRTQSAIGSIVATDSCYYTIGLGASSVPNLWDAVFSKVDFNGNVIFESFLENDTVSIQPMGWTNLEPTYDTNFVALAGYGDYFLFIKYNPSGDTLFTTVITEFLVNDNNMSVRPSTIIELPEDSSFMCLAMVENVITYETYFVLFNISNDGVLNYYNSYPMNEPDYYTMYPGGLVRIPSGYIISSYIIKLGTNPNKRQHLRYFKVNATGVLEQTWTDLEHPLDALPRGLIVTGDGGYLHGGITGTYDSSINGFNYKGQIVKLNASMDRDWTLILGDSTGSTWINFSQIINVSATEYVAVGHCYRDSMTVGWMIKFNLEGEMIWDSYFSYVPLTNSSQWPEHEIYDIKQTYDKGFIMAGSAHDVTLTMAGNPGSFGWLVKTDSVGCLVPDCQDFLNNNEVLKSELKLDLFPNPTSSVLNIYYYEPNFSGNVVMGVYDLNGKMIHEWIVTSNDMTYIYDISGLVSGTYVLKVYDKFLEKGSEKFIKI